MGDLKEWKIRNFVLWMREDRQESLYKTRNESRSFLTLTSKLAESLMRLGILQDAARAKELSPGDMIDSLLLDLHSSC